MPLPRKKDDGSSGAPVLNIFRAHVRFVDVEEHVEPYAITRKSDKATFTLDPQFSCTVEVVDDGRGGDDNGARFFEGFRYKQRARAAAGWRHSQRVVREAGDQARARHDRRHKDLQYPHGERQEPYYTGQVLSGYLSPELKMLSEPPAHDRGQGVRKRKAGALKLAIS
jgi:hypothetical protein